MLNLNNLDAGVTAGYVLLRVKIIVLDGRFQTLFHRVNCLYLQVLVALNFFVDLGVETLAAGDQIYYFKKAVELAQDQESLAEFVNGVDASLVHLDEFYQGVVLAVEDVEESSEAPTGQDSLNFVVKDDKARLALKIDGVL